MKQNFSKKIVFYFKLIRKILIYSLSRPSGFSRFKNLNPRLLNFFRTGNFLFFSKSNSWLKTSGLRFRIIRSLHGTVFHTSNHPGALCSNLLKVLLHEASRLDRDPPKNFQVIGVVFLSVYLIYCLWIKDTTLTKSRPGNTVTMLLVRTLGPPSENVISFNRVVN